MKLKYPCALVALFPLSAMAAQPDGLMAGVFTILVLGGFLWLTCYCSWFFTSTANIAAVGLSAAISIGPYPFRS
ncbi:hypothetical protein AYI82_20860 [Shewanella algae]|nr:hypothetical protein AYI82_20860 [Shewanella algae]